MLNKNNLNIAKLASKEDSKYTLAGILVTPQHTVVTDGVVLFVVANSALEVADFPKVGDAEAIGSFKSFILPSDAALNIPKVLPKKEPIPILNHAAVTAVQEGEAGITATIITTNLETSNRFDVHCTGGTFPMWEAVLPDTAKARLTMTVDADRLISLLQQFVFAKSPAVTLSIQDAESAIRLDGVSDEGQHLTGVLMPMRTSKLETENTEAEAAVNMNEMSAG